MGREKRIISHKLRLSEITVFSETPYKNSLFLIAKYLLQTVTILQQEDFLIAIYEKGRIFK